MRLKKHMMFFGLLVLTLMVAAGSAVFAQDENTTTTAVTDDQVNEVAKRMYCPVCENIPLDTCGTAACADWRAEIRMMLENGYTEQQIRQDFIARFGERVVGSPQDPFLWFLSVVVPFLLITVGLFYGARFMRNLRKAKPEADTGSAKSGDHYYDILERDISG